jgi:hypothetical protein
MDKNNSPYSPLPEQPPSPYPPTPYPPPEQANPYPPPPQQGGEYVLSQQQPYVSYQQGGGYNPQQGYPPQQQPYGTPQPYAGQGGYAQPYAQPYNPLQNPAGYNTIVVTGDSDAPFIATSESACTQLGNTPKYLLLAVARPSVSTYNTLKMNASWFVVFFLLCVHAALHTILAVVQYETEYYRIYEWYDSLGFQIAYTFFSVPLFFFLRCGLLYLVTKSMDRSRLELVTHPKFLQFLYISLLIYVPLGIIEASVRMIPDIGMWLGLTVWVYSLALCIIGLRGVFHISTGQAVAVIIIYVLIVIGMYIFIIVVFSTALLYVLVH